MRRAYLLAGAVILVVAACRQAPRQAAAAPAEATRPAAPSREGTRYGVGRPATPGEVTQVDIDVGPDGAGLPSGSGTATQGAELFKQKCAMCHGQKGEGIAPVYPALIGRDPRKGFPFGADWKIVKTVGNYWPYATTLFDYVRRAMPYTAPGSLSNNEVYALTAHILAANEVIPKDATLDSASLVAVKMPAHDRFVPDDRRGGPEVK
jgi:S-disulfanyl-L-cysteine oxidoreductase SoxD